MTERTLYDALIFLIMGAIYFYFVMRCVTAGVWTRRAMRETDTIIEQRMKKGLVTEDEIRLAFGCLVPQFNRICFNPFIRTYEQAFPWLAEYQRTRPLL